jgi:lysophospholipase L1-like esterase
MKQKIFWASLVLNLLLIFSIVMAWQYMPYRLQHRLKVYNQEHYERKTSLFDSLPNQANEIVFLGDDLIEEGHWQELFHHSNIGSNVRLNVINRGISGDDSQGVLKRLGEVTASKPAQIYLLIGYNDLMQGVSKQLLQENYLKIVQQIRKESPKTQIYIHSITPIAYRSGHKNIENEDIMVVNGLLKEFAQSQNIGYVDLFSALMGNTTTHEIDAKYSNSGYQLTEEGYIRWKALIEQYLNDKPVILK